MDASPVWSWGMKTRRTFRSRTEGETFPDMTHSRSSAECENWEDTHVILCRWLTAFWRESSREASRLNPVPCKHLHPVPWRTFFCVILESCASYSTTGSMVLSPADIDVERTYLACSETVLLHRQLTMWKGFISVIRESTAAPATQQRISGPKAYNKPTEEQLTHAFQEVTTACPLKTRLWFFRTLVCDSHCWDCVTIWNFTFFEPAVESQYGSPWSR